MIIIRLKANPNKKKLTYAVIVTTATGSVQSNKFLEKIGFYKPEIDKWSNKYLFIDFDKLKFWLERGARVNMSLYILLRAWFSYQYMYQWKFEKVNGATHAYVKLINK